MRNYQQCRLLGAALACVLTLAASGDDICVPRLVFPSIDLTSATPLDDPTCDFVEQTAEPANRRATSRSSTANGPLPVTVAGSKADLPLYSCASVNRDAGPPNLSDFHMPLRC